jgi:hypothetical protein
VVADLPREAVSVATVHSRLRCFIIRASRAVLGDESIPQALAAHRTSAVDGISDFGSQAGDTHAILAVGLIAGAVAIGVIRSWRPAVSSLS